MDRKVLIININVTLNNIKNKFNTGNINTVAAFSTTSNLGIGQSIFINQKHTYQFSSLVLRTVQHREVSEWMNKGQGQIIIIGPR